MNSHKRMFVRIIWKAFAHRFSRVLIASLAIAMGASTLSGLGLVAVTVPDSIAKELRSFGANLVVLPQGSNVITPETVSAIDRQCGESLLGRAGYSYGNLLYGQQPVPLMVTKFADARSVRPYWSIEGKVPQGSEQILLGVNLAEKFRLHVGDLIGLKVAQLRENNDEQNSGDVNHSGKQLEISGLLRTGGPEDDLAVLSPDSYTAMGGVADHYSLVEYSLKGDTAQLSALAKTIEKKVNGIDAEVVRRTTQNETRIAHTLSNLIWVVSIIISALMLIAVSATLSSIVSERAREIGLKKALGALSKDVFTELIGESILLGLFGGFLGVLLGIGLADYILQKVFLARVEINWIIIVLTIVFSVAVAVIGSLWPAKRIARINPINVLGGE